MILVSNANLMPFIS